MDLPSYRKPALTVRHLGAKLLGYTTLLLIFAAGSPAQANLIRLQLDEGVFVQVTPLPKEGLELALECHVPAGQEPRPFYAKYTNDEEIASSYAAARNVVIPFKQLSPETRRAMLLAVFPEDFIDDSGLQHKVRFGGGEYQETLGDLCQWFTGNGLNWHLVHEMNNLTHEQLREGMIIKFPASVLRAELREPTADRTPPKPPVEPPDSEEAERVMMAQEAEPDVPEVDDEVPADEVVDPHYDESDHVDVVNAVVMDEVEAQEIVDPETAAEEDAPSADELRAIEAIRRELEYGSDDKGAFAAYRLKRGEALYSAVVVRYTDFTHFTDVMGAVEAITRRSGIADVRNIAEGQRILIPVEMLSPQFRPLTNLARQEYEASVAASERIQQEMRHDGRGRDLEGVVIVLDPGHGSRDVGKMHPASGLYEDEINYDIACRIKEIIESQTRARVYLTMVDPSTGYEPTDARRFLQDDDEVVLTSPQYPANPEQYNTHVSANLRFYLANDIYDKETAAGVDPRNIVFTSIHIDSLHPRLRGAMIYIPGARIRGKRDSEYHTTASYAGIQEVRKVSFTADDCRRDEALSRAFAQTLYDELGKKRIKRFDVGPAIRSEIRQSGGVVYVPAVIRGNKIPTKILLECANMNNETDRKRVADPDWRQWVAEAYVNALIAHYGG